MALTKDQKQKQIEDIKNRISNQKSMVFADFSNVPSKDMFSLRKSLKEAGCNLKIVKKTLARIAFGQSGISFWNKIKAVVPGQLALVFGIEDEIAPARISNQFAKKQENFKILGGIFPVQGARLPDGQWQAPGLVFIDKPKVLELASIPPRNELLGRLVGSLSSPMASLARVLDKIRESKASV